jgi:ABC-type lipoprotein export system ATPase subunit
MSPHGTEAAVIEVHGLEVSFNSPSARINVLNDVHMNVARGEHVAIVGPSGSGKSSLLYTLLGLLRPTAGSIRLLGTDVTALSGRELSRLRLHEVGFVFQNPNLFSRMSIADNIALPLRLAGLSKKSARARAIPLVEQLGLSHRQQQQARRLSAGEQQRVAVGRALIGSPSVVLADEPTANLDRENASAIVELLKVSAGAERALVVVTHDPAVARQMTRVLRIRAGRLEEASGDDFDAVSEGE